MNKSQYKILSIIILYSLIYTLTFLLTIFLFFGLIDLILSEVYV